MQSYAKFINSERDIRTVRKAVGDGIATRRNDCRTDMKKVVIGKY